MTLFFFCFSGRTKAQEVSLQRKPVTSHLFPALLTYVFVHYHRERKNRAKKLRGTAKVKKATDAKKK